MKDSIEKSITTFLQEKNKFNNEHELNDIILLGTNAVLDSLDTLLLITELEGIIGRFSKSCDLMNILYNDQLTGQSFTVRRLIQYIQDNSKAK